MNQTENTESNSSDERIRKIFAKDVKPGETIHTVFRAAHKEKHTSRGGKSYLTLTLVDRTGSIDGRVFDNVDAADQAFSVDDYLLVKGKVGQFKGHTQLVVDRLERLDPGPIDAAEFAYTAPPPPPAREEKPAKAERDEHTAAKVRLSKRLERLLENPQLVQALDNFVGHLEKALNAQAGHAPAAKPERERKPKAPRVDHKPKAEEPKRDPSLPEGLAFKPFNALVGDDKPSESSNS